MGWGKAAIYVAVVVTTVWAISTVWSIVHPAYEPDPSIHSVMLTVAGAFLGVGIVQRRRDENRPPGPPEEPPPPPRRRKGGSGG